MSKQLLNRLRATRTPADRVPAGWFTAQQWADKWGLSLSQASIYLRTGIKQGLVEQARYHVHTGRGVYPVPHYRETKEGRR